MAQRPIVVSAACGLVSVCLVHSELDVNGNGFIQGEELKLMVDWVWSSMHPGTAPLAEQQRAALAKNLLAKIDKNSDGKLTLEEFAPWYAEASQQIQAVQKQEERKTRAAGEAATAAASLAALAFGRATSPLKRKWRCPRCLCLLRLSHVSPSWPRPASLPPPSVLLPPPLSPWAPLQRRWD